MSTTESYPVRDDYHQGITDGLTGRPYAGNLPGVCSRSYNDGYDEGSIERRANEEAAAAPGKPETMGDRIRVLRKGLRLSLGKLGEIAGCSKSYLWELETGGMTRPSADKLSEIASALGVSIDHLVSGKEGLPTTEKMREACLEAVRREAVGWRLSAHFGPFADFMATRMQTAIRAIDAQASR